MGVRKRRESRGGVFVEGSGGEGDVVFFGEGEDEGEVP